MENAKKIIYGLILIGILAIATQPESYELSRPVEIILITKN